jgi:hypothetical protein
MSGYPRTETAACTIEEEQHMNTKRLAIFGGAALVVAGALVYSLGIYPPASGRNGQGAIGERQVYRAEQPKDASVTPGTAPVALQASAEQMKKGQIFELKNGQIVQLSNGGFALQFRNGDLLPLNNAQFSHLNSALLTNALTSELRPNQMMQVSANQFVFQLKGDRFVAQLKDGMYLALANGNFVQLQNGAFSQMNGQLMQLTQSQLQANFARQ